MICSLICSRQATSFLMEENYQAMESSDGLKSNCDTNNKDGDIFIDFKRHPGRNPHFSGEELGKKFLLIVLSGE